MPLHPTQLERMTIHLQRVPWGDVPGAVRDVEKALCLGSGATAPHYRMWLEGEHALFEREFDLTRAEVEGLSDEWRLAYVGQLLASLSFAWHGLAPLIDTLAKVADPDYEGGLYERDLAERRS